MTQKPSERIEEIARELAYMDCGEARSERCAWYAEEHWREFLQQATIRYLDEEAEKKDQERCCHGVWLSDTCYQCEELNLDRG